MKIGMDETTEQRLESSRKIILDDEESWPLFTNTAKRFSIPRMSEEISNRQTESVVSDDEPKFSKMNCPDASCKISLPLNQRLDRKNSMA